MFRQLHFLMRRHATWTNRQRRNLRLWEEVTPMWPVDMFRNVYCSLPGNEAHAFATRHELNHKRQGCNRVTFDREEHTFVARHRAHVRNATNNARDSRVRWSLHDPRSKLKISQSRSDMGIGEQHGRHRTEKEDTTSPRRRVKQESDFIVGSQI